METEDCHDEDARADQISNLTCRRGFNGGGIPSTQRKDAHNSNLLPARELEAFQRRHRVDNNHDIREDVDCRVGEPEALFVETVSVDVFVPEFGDRNAVEPGAEDGPGTVDRYKSNHAVAYDAHALRGEDTQV